MSRRRLRLICSSDEEEEENQIPQQPEPENQNRDPNVVPDPYPSEPLEISDDDVEEEESSTSPITSLLPIQIRIPITTSHNKLRRRIPPVKARVSGRLMFPTTPRNQIQPPVEENKSAQARVFRSEIFSGG
uniref:Uncharacterized protein n=1 Tax=Quercus lobata TaxID=97700 RepID=A0A7N2MMF4_QUELO